MARRTDRDTEEQLARSIRIIWPALFFLGWIGGMYGERIRFPGRCPELGNFPVDTLVHVATHRVRKRMERTARRLLAALVCRTNCHRDPWHRRLLFCGRNSRKLSLSLPEPSWVAERGQNFRVLLFRLYRPPPRRPFHLGSIHLPFISRASSLYLRKTPRHVTKACIDLSDGPDCAACGVCVGPKNKE
jgi:hypothetical protein